MLSTVNKTIVCLVLLICMGGCAIAPDQGNSRSREADINVDSDVRKDFNRAVTLLKDEDYSGAIGLLKKVVEQEQRLTAPYVNLGMAYSRQGKTKQAEEAFMRALDIDLTHPVANNELGLLYRKNGRFEEARKAYTNVLTEHEDYLPVIRNLGILCELYIQDLQCALEQYKQYIKYVPDDETVGLWVADLERRLGQ